MRQIPRRSIWKSASEFKPDIVFVQFSIAAVNVDLWSVRSLCKRFLNARIPVVIAYHEATREYDLLGIVTRLIYKAMTRVTNVPIVFSSAGRQALIDRHLFDEVVEVPHGTRGVTELAETDLNRVRDLYQVQKPLVLALGFTDSDKGTDVLLGAAEAIAVGVGNNVQFLIAGAPRRRRGVFRIMERRDVQYRRGLTKLAATMSHVEIAFCDYVADQDVAALLRLADVVALPYRRVTQSGIGNLALSSRSVLVSSNLPGLESNLGNAAKYVATGDSKAMAEQIIGLLGEENASLREHMRELSGMRAASNTFEEVAETILSAGLAHRPIPD
jgi:glycosyltransferase involved in cell wall biosynthesis